MTEGPVVMALDLHQGRTAFEPGGSVSGVAAWSVPVAPSGIELRLIWATLGPGGRDFTIAETIPFARPVAEERRPFTLKLPMAPYSFRGSLISLAWTLELVALPGEEKARIDLTVAPDRQGIDLRSESVPQPAGPLDGSSTS